MKKFYLLTLVLMIFSLYTGCKKDNGNEKKPDPPDLSVINISQESEWDYMVLGKSDYYFVKAKNSSSPEAVLFHSSEANKDYSIFIDNGKIDKVVVDDYIFLFRNFNGNKVDLGVVFPNGEVKVFRELETDYDWDAQQCIGGKSTEAWSDVIRGASRVAAGVPCALSVAAAIGSSGIATPVALWTCGNFLLGLTADVMQNDFEVHNGFTDFTNQYGLASTAVSCSSGDPVGCLSDLSSGALSEWADHQEEIENRQDDIQILEGALEYGYGDVQITLTWDNTADLDLHVFDPNDEEIYWNHPYSNSGGDLDVDDIDGYGPENIYWPENEAPNGNYGVYVHHYVWDNSGYPTTSNYTVLINAFGNIEKFTGTISLDETVHITDFNHNGFKTEVQKNTFSITKSKK